MELRQLRYFVTVAEELHFGRAAERLHIVQPAVSQQVRRLEREWGLVLFDRSSRHVRLTTDGERMLDEARAVLAAADRATTVAANLAGGSGRVVRLGVSPGLETRVASGVARLRADAPDLTVRVDSRPVHDQVDAVRSGDLDLALVRAFPGQPGLQAVRVWHDDLAVAVPAGHRLAASDALAVSDLAGLPLRLVARDCDPFVHDFVVDACRAAGVEPRLDRPAGRPQDTLVEIATGPPAWTVLVGDVPDAPAGVAVRPLRPHVQVQGFLVMPVESAGCAGQVAAAFDGRAA